MKKASANRSPFPDGERTIAVLLVVVFGLAHPVPASELHYCSRIGGLVERNHVCRSSGGAGSCCTGQSARKPASCCPGAAEKKQVPARGLSIASPSCAGCCREYSLAGIESIVAVTASSAGDVETTLRGFSDGPVEFLTRPARSVSFRSSEPLDLPPGRAIYLLVCRFLV